MHRFAAEQPDVIYMAVETRGSKVEAIVPYGPGVMAAGQATGSIPIVIDFDLTRWVTGGRELGAPGGNVTGLLLASDLNGNRCCCFKEAVPTLTRAAVVVIQRAPISELESLRNAASASALTRIFEVSRDL